MEVMTRTNSAQEIIAQAEDCAAQGITVCITDGTVCRIAEKLEINSNLVYGSYLDIYSAKSGWIALQMNSYGHLEGYSAALYPDGCYYIAPDWWHNIGN